MKIFIEPIGPIAANCTLLVDEQSGEAAIFDVGEYGSGVERLLSKGGEIQLKYIVLTHRHFDHLLGVHELQKKTGATVLISEADSCGLTDSVSSLAAKHGLSQQPVDNFKMVADGDIIRIGGVELKAMSTPGHTVGGMCFICEQERLIIAGDTVFYLSCGRTDLPSGSSSDMMKSLSKLAELSGDYDIICGHGQSTTLEFERANNPYFR